MAAAALTLLVGGCASVVPTDSAAPSRTSGTTPTVPPTPTPSAMLTPSLLPQAAELEIDARGDYQSREECVLLIINMGGCQPWLVVDPLGMAHAAA
jgi:hypothetical protein